MGKPSLCKGKLLARGAATQWRGQLGSDPRHVLPFWLAPRARAQRGNAQGTTGGLPGGGATGRSEHQKLRNSGGGAHCPAG